MPGRAGAVNGEGLRVRAEFLRLVATDPERSAPWLRFSAQGV
jgi:hypothetical protein